eukprot:9050908-Alexandrium_andersonii.AAC.1
MRSELPHRALRGEPRTHSPRTRRTPGKRKRTRRNLRTRASRRHPQPQGRPAWPRNQRTPGHPQERPARFRRQQTPKHSGGPGDCYLQPTVRVLPEPSAGRTGLPVVAGSRPRMGWPLSLIHISEPTRLALI